MLVNLQKSLQKSLRRLMSRQRRNLSLRRLSSNLQSMSLLWASGGFIYHVIGRLMRRWPKSVPVGFVVSGSMRRSLCVCKIVHRTRVSATTTTTDEMLVHTSPGMEMRPSLCVPKRSPLESHVVSKVASFARRAPSIISSAKKGNVSPPSSRAKSTKTVERTSARLLSAISHRGLPATISRGVSKENKPLKERAVQIRTCVLHPIDASTSRTQIKRFACVRVPRRLTVNTVQGQLLLALSRGTRRVGFVYSPTV